MQLHISSSECRAKAYSKEEHIGRIWKNGFGHLSSLLVKLTKNNQSSTVLIISGNMHEHYIIYAHVWQKVHTTECNNVEVVLGLALKPVYVHEVIPLQRVQLHPDLDGLQCKSLVEMIWSRTAGWWNPQACSIKAVVIPCCIDIWPYMSVCTYFSLHQWWEL